MIGQTARRRPREMAVVSDVAVAARASTGDVWAMCEHLWKITTTVRWGTDGACVTRKFLFNCKNYFGLGRVAPAGGRYSQVQLLFLRGTF